MEVAVDEANKRLKSNRGIQKRKKVAGIQNLFSVTSNTTTTSNDLCSGAWKKWK